MKLPIRVRLTVAFGVVLAVVLVAVGAAVFVRFRASANAAVDAELRARPESFFGAADPAPQLRIDLLGVADEHFGQVLNRAGEVVAMSAQLRGRLVAHAHVGFRTLTIRTRTERRRVRWLTTRRAGLTLNAGERAGRSRRGAEQPVERLRSAARRDAERDARSDPGELRAAADLRRPGQPRASDASREFVDATRSRAPPGAEWGRAACRVDGRSRRVASSRSARVEAEAMVSAVVDPVRVRQALTNLIDNALGVTPRGGQVMVHSVDSTDGLLLAVSDSGPGFPPELRDTAFEMFVRGRGDLDSSEGAGLGLAIVAGVAEAHGGRAWIGPADGGAIVTMVFPHTDPRL